jgi:hypothetical protein
MNSIFVRILIVIIAVAAAATTAYEAGLLHHFLDGVAEAVAKIPGAFWAIVGTLGGVWLTNRESARRLDRQFSNDRTVRADERENDQVVRSNEREFALRREIYMEAADVLYGGVMAIARMTSVDTSVGDISKEFLERSSVLAKVQVVAKIETLKAVIEVGAEVANHIATLSAKRIPLDVQKRQLAQLEEQAIALAKEANRQADLAKLREKIAKDHMNHARAVLALGRETIGITMALRQSFVPTILAIRAELGLPIDRADLDAIMNPLIDTQRAHMDRTLGEISSFLDAQEALLAPRQPRS